ncbi:MAG: ABC transporter permease [Candidatus Omnitrophica bacterium]|nr:ABC transporter permease [Candidatus Omnitrophota bacterium]
MSFVIFKNLAGRIHAMGEAIFFLKDVLKVMFSGRVRFAQVLEQMYYQGVQSVVIIILSSLATGVVLGLQGSITLQRFGAREFIAPLVALSLLRELSPVFTTFIYSGKSGAGITAELGTMNTHEQIQATRTLGVDPIEFLVVPRFLACVLVMPALVVISELVGMFGGYLVAIFQAQLPSAIYIRQTIQSIHYVDFFSGLVKAFFFSVIVAWICCYQGFFTSGGALGVGRFTTRAVAYSYMAVILSNAVLTMFILTFWG